MWGASWGVTLGLAYAERYPERVSEMILLSITLTRPSDVHWLGHEVGPLLPRGVGEVPGRRSRGRTGRRPRRGLRPAAQRRSGPRASRRAAARDWVAWEDAILSLEEGYVVPNPRWSDERYRVAFARLVTHYFSHAAWLAEDELLGNAGRLADIPGVLVHGRLDLAGPAGRRLAARAGVAGLRAPLRLRRAHGRRRDGPAPPRVHRSVRQPLTGPEERWITVLSWRAKRSTLPAHTVRRKIAWQT